jgi:ankyrin repeat protein
LNEILVDKWSDKTIMFRQFRQSLSIRKNIAISYLSILRQTQSKYVAFGPSPFRVYNPEEIKLCKYSEKLKSNNNPLCIAMELKDSYMISLLLEECNPTVNYNAALKLAVCIDDYQLVETLVKHPLVNITGKEFHILKLAAILEREKIVDFLLSLNLPIENWRMLEWAASYGQLKIFKHYLNQMKLSNNEYDHSIPSVFGSYVTTKDFPSDETFNWDGNGYHTILSSARRPYKTHTNLEMLNLLINDGNFKFVERANNGAYPLQSAISKGELEIIKLILSTFDEIPYNYLDYIMTAAYIGRIDIIDLLLDNHLISSIQLKQISNRLISERCWGISGNLSSCNELKRNYHELSLFLLKSPPSETITNDQSDKYDDNLNYKENKRLLIELLRHLKY